MSIHVTMKVIQIIKKQQKIVRSTRGSSEKYEKPNVKQSHNRGNSWVGRTKLQKQRVTTEKRAEITGIRKNKKNKV